MTKFWQENCNDISTLLAGLILWNTAFNAFWSCSLFAYNWHTKLDVQEDGAQPPPRRTAPMEQPMLLHDATGSLVTQPDRRLILKIERLRDKAILQVKRFVANVGLYIPKHARKRKYHWLARLLNLFLFPIIILLYPACSPTYKYYFGSQPFTASFLLANTACFIPFGIYWIWHGGLDYVLHDHQYSPQFWDNLLLVKLEQTHLIEERKQFYRSCLKWTYRSYGVLLIDLMIIAVQGMNVATVCYEDKEFTPKACSMLVFYELSKGCAHYSAWCLVICLLIQVRMYRKLSMLWLRYFETLMKQSQVLDAKSQENMQHALYNLQKFTGTFFWLLILVSIALLFIFFGVTFAQAKWIPDIFSTFIYGAVLGILSVSVWLKSLAQYLSEVFVIMLETFEMFREQMSQTDFSNIGAEEHKKSVQQISNVMRVLGIPTPQIEYFQNVANVSRLGAKRVTRVLTGPNALPELIAQARTSSLSDITKASTWKDFADSYENFEVFLSSPDLQDFFNRSEKGKSILGAMSSAVSKLNTLMGVVNSFDLSMYFEVDLDNAGNLKELLLELTNHWRSLFLSQDAGQALVDQVYTELSAVEMFLEAAGQDVPQLAAIKMGLEKFGCKRSPDSIETGLKGSKTWRFLYQHLQKRSKKLSSSEARMSLKMLQVLFDKFNLNSEELVEIRSLCEQLLEQHEEIDFVSRREMFSGESEFLNYVFFKVLAPNSPNLLAVPSDRSSVRFADSILSIEPNYTKMKTI